MIQMEEKPSDPDAGEIDRYGAAMTFMERVMRYPGVENVAFSNASAPYGGYNWWSGYLINEDSVHQTIRERFVTSDFFDVFKMNIRRGRIFDWKDHAAEKEVVISPIRKDLFGGSYENDSPIPIDEVHTLRYSHDWDATKADYKVIGITDKIKDSFYEPYFSNNIHPLKKEDVNLSRNQITIRVHPEADKNFADKFMEEMREQLFIGPYYLSSVSSIKERRDLEADYWGVSARLNSVYAITFFLVVNIFLGILGSFRFRAQSRCSEIGLRIALGSSKRKVKGMIIAETLFLLIIAAVVGTGICLSVGSPEIIQALGIPTVNKGVWGIGFEQNIINFLITFLFIAGVSFIAVWYPAKEASDTQPAEALHNE
jgi:ABC-type transport system, involved in lipoprotein release, permease component